MTADKRHPTAAKGLVLGGKAEAIADQAKGRKLPVTVDPGLPLAYKKTLFVAPGTRVPWDLLPAAWHFLERWDCAVPLWRYGVNAADVGSKAERQRTQAVVRDLRVLLYSVELLFVKDNADGRALMAAYRDELVDSSEPRLAFLRALYRVKPRCCVLPVTWLAEVASRSKQDARARTGRPPRRTGPLVVVEVEPGRFVKCHAGDEEAVLEQFAQQRGRRGG